MIKKQYNEYVSELEKDLICMLNTKGKILIQAPPGAGKTFAIIQAFKKLSLKYPNKVYVIACPNRSQNEQNSTLYGVYAIVGGKAINKGLSIASMVYDKAKELQEYLIKESKELVLVVDEAHQLIDSCTFRENALQQLQELESVAITTIHLTATPSKLLELYKYDETYKLEPVKKKANIKEHTLGILFNENILSQFVPFIKSQRNSTNKIPYIYLNSLKKIEECYGALTSQGYKVGIVANKDKIKEKIKVDKYPALLQETENILDSIRNKAMLPTENYDFIFATSIVECGVSLKNTDIIHINLLLKAEDIDFDSGEQRSARPRNIINSAFTIIPDVEQMPIKCKDSIFNQVEYEVNRIRKKYQRLFDIDIEEFGLEYAQKHINAILKLETDKRLHYGTLEVEDNKIVINKERLVKAQFKEYQKQFFYNHKEFNDILKETIKADKFSAIKFKDLSKEEDKDSLKIVKEQQEEEREVIRVKAIEVYKKFLKQDANFLLEYISNSDVFKDLPKDIQENINILKQEETLYGLLKELLEQQLDIDKAINVILETISKSEQEEKPISIVQQIKDYIKLCNYVNRNKSKYIENITDEYSTYRDIFDKVMKDQGRVTDDKLIELTKSLIDNKIIRGKEKIRFIKMMDKYEKKKKISKANTTKLMKPLEMIYKLSKDKISSLRKQI